MRKFLLLAAIICITWLVFGTAVPATAFTLNPDDAAQLKTEKPLTQTDIKTFITYGPSLIKAFETNDTGMADTVMLQAGWNKIRCVYVVAKIGNGYAISIQPQAAKAMLQSSGMPAVLMPSSAELELIKQNISALTDLFGALTVPKP